VVIDDRDGRLAPLAGRWPRRCAPAHRLAATADADSKTAPVGSGADFTDDLRERDGSEGEMCGNGARCVARRAADLGLVRDRALFPDRRRPIRATLGRLW